MSYRSLSLRAQYQLLGIRLSEVERCLIEAKHEWNSHAQFLLYLRTNHGWSAHRDPIYADVTRDLARARIKQDSLVMEARTLQLRIKAVYRKLALQGEFQHTELL